MEKIEEDIGFEVREEFMISPNGDPEPTKRLAHFLKPCTNSFNGQVFDLPSHCFSSLPPVFEPKNWPLKVNFHGWRSPQKNWKAWVEKMAALHESTWKQTGIHDAILNSTYEIRRNCDLVIGLAEKWCPETKSFIFSWGEATITLEDVMIAGYSVLGSPVFSPLETAELMETREKLNQARNELNRSTDKKVGQYKWMIKFMDSGSEIEQEAFLALWLSRYVFPSSVCVIDKSVFPIAVHLSKGTRISLAPAILASIYVDLSLFKEKIVAMSVVDKWEDKGSKLEITICSPFQLVQIWAWERFKDLRPEPNLIKSGEPRFAQWHKLKMGVENVRTVLDSAQESFDWRPYAKTSYNWKLPMFYGEKGISVLVDDHLSEELQSWDRCLRVSELVGLNCIVQYLPQRVAMQFGMDQDLPVSVARVNNSPKIAWRYYCKPITCANLYVPSRLYEAGVTTRYLKWWKQSLSRMQSASDDALPERKNLSKGVTESSFTGVKKTPKQTKRIKDDGILSGSKKAPDRSKGGEQKNFTTSCKTEANRFDGMKKGDAASTRTLFSFMSFKRSPETSKRKNGGSDCSAALGSPLKKAKKQVKFSKEKKTVGHAPASVELDSKKKSLNLEVKKEANDSVPPGFPPKSNLALASDSSAALGSPLEKDKKQVEVSKEKKNVGHATASVELDSKRQSPNLEVKKKANDSIPPGFRPKSNLVAESDPSAEDNLTIAEVLESRKKRDGFWSEQVSSTENLAIQSEAFSSTADCEGVKVIEPQSQTELVEKIIHNEHVKGGSETAIEDSTVSKLGGSAHDLVRMKGCKGDDNINNNDISEIPGLRLEEWVSRLEMIIAKLKAEKFGHEIQP